MAISIDLEIVSCPGYSILDGQTFPMTSGDDISWACSPLCCIQCAFMLDATDRLLDQLSITVDGETVPGGPQSPPAPVVDEEAGTFVSDFQYTRPGNVNPDVVGVRVHGAGMPIGQMPIRGIRAMRMEPRSAVTIEVWDSNQETLLGTWTTDANGLVDLRLPPPNGLPAGSYQVHAIYGAQPTYESWTPITLSPGTNAHVTVPQGIAPGS